MIANREIIAATRKFAGQSTAKPCNRKWLTVVRGALSQIKVHETEKSQCERKIGRSHNGTETQCPIPIWECTRSPPRSPRQQVYNARKSRFVK